MEALTRPIFLLTDFGTRDQYAGQVRAAIASVAPGAPIHDLTHEVEPFAVDEGAWLLECSLGVLPEDAVVLAVVDPGVGSGRRALAAQCGRRAFVGPDNGILSGIVPEELRESPGQDGGVCRVESAALGVHEITERRFQRPQVSATFHGRDIFAPAAANLASGVEIGELGPQVRELFVLAPFRGRPGSDGVLTGHVVHVDRYGNLVTTIRAEQLAGDSVVEVAGRTIEMRAATFASVPAGVPFFHVDSSGFVAVAVNKGSAATLLGSRRGDYVTVKRR